MVSDAAIGVGRPRDDRGVLSAFLALLAVALFVLVGLVVDGGRAMSAHQVAENEAEQAARAGAGQLSIDALRAGRFVIDPTAAVQAAHAYTIAAGHPGTATVTAGKVTVTVTITIPTSVLGIIGIGRLTVSATSSAIDVHGETEAD